MRLGKELGKQLFSEIRVASSISSTKSWTAISLDSPVNASLTTRDHSLGPEDLNSHNVPGEDKGMLVCVTAGFTISVLHSVFYSLKLVLLVFRLFVDVFIHINATSDHTQSGLSIHRRTYAFQWRSLRHVLL